MLSKKRRINSSIIKKVLHSGASYSSPLLSLKVIKGPKPRSSLMTLRVRTTFAASSLGRGVSKLAPHSSLVAIKDTPDTGFSVSVSSRITKTKVHRNKIKRRIYSIISSVFKNISPAQGFIFVKKDPIKIPFKELKREILDLFVKAGII